MNICRLTDFLFLLSGLTRLCGLTEPESISSVITDENQLTAGYCSPAAAQSTRRLTVQSAIFNSIFSFCTPCSSWHPLYLMHNINVCYSSRVDRSEELSFIIGLNFWYWVGRIELSYDLLLVPKCEITSLMTGVSSVAGSSHCPPTSLYTVTSYSCYVSVRMS